MSGNTSNQGYPYPLVTDFADVQDAYRLAVAVDADLRAAQAAFRAFEQTPSFVTRQTSNGSGFTSGSQTFRIGAVDWDNTGGAVVNASSWVQPVSQAPSWWMFGATLLSTNISGTVTVGDLVMGRISVSTTDQVSGVVTTSTAFQRQDESNTSGEWINIFTMASLYQGSASLSLILNGGSTKAISSGSTFWGLYLGPVT